MKLTPAEQARIIEATVKGTIFEVVEQLIEEHAPPSRIRTEWAIKWGDETWTTLLGSEEYARRKASPAHGDVILKRTRRHYSETVADWEPADA